MNMVSLALKLKLILLFILAMVFVSPNFFILALTQEDCQTREECEELLKRHEEEIKKLEGAIARTKQEQRTIQNQIRILRSTIQKLNLQIRQGNVMIKDLGYQIEDTESSIEQTSLRIEDSREKLAGILRTIYKEDKKSSIEVLFSGETLSDFFDNLIALETLNLKSQEFLGEIKNLKETLEQQKDLLDSEKSDLERSVRIQVLRRQESEVTRKEQERLGRMTEVQYQQYLKEKEEAEKAVAEIRARIFELIGVPEAPTFGEALDLANWVQDQTGIRPAFLLAIITQESALGRNVGQCYLPRDPAENQRRRVMHPTRDVPHFLNITQELGRDPYNTLISCPMTFGFGGAMGPAQFIPSTWMNRRPILEPFIQEIPNPWDIRHSFLASALYLRDNGGQNDERRAALRYFAGGNWANPRFAFYGNQVVTRVDCLQTFIDHGTMTERCGRLIFIPK